MIKRPAKKRAAAKRAKKAPAKKPALRRRGIVKAHPDVIKALLTAKTAGGTIAPGFKPQRRLNLKFMGGRTIPKLSFRSFYLGGPKWADSDIHNIDKALSGAMSDPHLTTSCSSIFRAPARHDEFRQIGQGHRGSAVSVHLMAERHAAGL